MKFSYPHSLFLTAAMSRGAKPEGVTITARITQYGIQTGHREWPDNRPAAVEAQPPVLVLNCHQFSDSILFHICARALLNNLASGHHQILIRQFSGKVIELLNQ